MIHHRQKSEVRRFDIIKLVVLIVLIALLLWFWLSPPAFVQGTDDVDDVVEDTAVATQPNSDIEAEPETASNPAEEAAAEEAVSIDVPVLESPTLADGLEVGSVTLSGSGTSGSTVRIVLDGDEVGLVDVDADGRWSFDLDLAEGSRTLSLDALDADGNVATSVDFPAFDVAAAPVTMLDIPILNLPDGDLLGGVVTLNGIGTPGSEVGVVVDGELVGTTAVGEDGTWSLETDLAAGEHDVCLQAIDIDGNVAVESDEFDLSLAELTLPEFNLPTFDLPETDLTGGEVTLTGSGTPGSEIEIVLNGEVVGTAVVADDGAWHLSTALPAGEYELVLRTIDGSGTAVETDPFNFSLAAAEAPAEEVTEDSAETSLPADYCKNAAPGIDQGDTYIVGVCEWLTKIARRLGIDYPALIGVNPQIENPNLIYPGQVINLPPR